MGFSELCVMQVVRLATTHVTSLAAPSASLFWWLCIMSDGLPRESLDRMVALSCMPDTFARARTWPKGLTKQRLGQAHDERVSCIQGFYACALN